MILGSLIGKENGGQGSKDPKLAKVLIIQANIHRLRTFSVLHTDAHYRAKLAFQSMCCTNAPFGEVGLHL